MCIEPDPQPRLTASCAEFTLVQKRVQDADLSLFERLCENDILFIDSSHVVTVASDVCVEVLEILPYLRSGVWVHIHDIFFPQDYPARYILEKRLAWNEQYLLEAFLSFNAAFQIKLANHWLMLDHLDAVRALCPDETLKTQYGSAEIASLWMQRL